MWKPSHLALAFGSKGICHYIRLTDLVHH